MLTLLSSSSSTGFALAIWACSVSFINAALAPAPCNKTRKIYTEPYGTITDGPPGTNYTQDSHCEWLIKAKSSQFITLNFLHMGTECSFDYVFVYDGASFDSKLLGSFSGKTEPQNVTASSGYMLIVLYSDTNYVLDGFKAEYAIFDCPNNCNNRGDCLTNKCICEPYWGGEDCSVELCPNFCNRNGVCRENKCHCYKGYTGEACSLHDFDKDGNSWHWVSHSAASLTPRAAHSAVYVNHTNSLYIFGGYDLNKVLSSMEIYRFSINRWEDENGKEIHKFPDFNFTYLFQNLNQSTNNGTNIFTRVISSLSQNNQKNLHNSPFGIFSDSPFADSLVDLKEQSSTEKVIDTNKAQPSPRYGHAACSFKNGFVLFGGKFANRSLSNELWFYDTFTNRWTLRAVNSDLKPVAVTRHTIAAVGEDIYIFGGATSEKEFSSRMFKITMSTPESERWEQVVSRGGKDFDVRLVAHTMAYHSHSHSLLVYGGVVATAARFSKLSDRMFIFDIENKYWSEIHYPKGNVRDTFIPRERAFHSATIIGNYMVIFGGYSHRHNKEEICYDGHLYIYHLGCHAWISLDVLGKLKNGYPKKQGVFAHAAALKPPSTLLIAGGYHGNVNGDLLAFVIPPWQAGIQSHEPEASCPRHKTQASCLADPECGWCSADEICYGRTVGSNCTTNLQSMRCGGICPALQDCRSCLIQGPPEEALKSNTSKRSALPSVSTKLGLNHCSWCVQNSKCHHKDDNYGVCGEDTPSQNPGWWGATGEEIVNADSCGTSSPGLTFLRHLQPADLLHPDEVAIHNATFADWGANGGSSHFVKGPSEARLRGWLHLPTNWDSATETLILCAYNANVTLKLDDRNVTIVNKMQNCAPVDLNGITLGRISVDLLAEDSLLGGLYPSHHRSKMELIHNRTLENPKPFTYEYLEPYSNGSCSQYDGCLSCLADAACGWCELTAKCESRSVDEKMICSTSEEWRFLTLRPNSCPGCKDLISCARCTLEEQCEWWPDEARCTRRGRAVGAITSLDTCPPSCRERSDCASCLDERGRCVWCATTQECFSFNVYTSEYQFGQCREWLDRPPGPVDKSMRRADQCESCQRKSDCASCLQSLGCGWCHSQEKPFSGKCADGSFVQPQGNCAVLLGDNVTDAEWAYAQCPDVDECGLGIDECHEHAICQNTHGSYSCACKRGYSGDGKLSCKQTCYDTCVHGYCNGPPQYRCRCDLGWTGDDCSQDCGCHNHSTCDSGPQICDECQGWTEGPFCERCKPGSHGNATASQGCRRCDCNDHGDESKGVCDSQTGICFCKDNTEGADCTRCADGFYGDPRHGGRCYSRCEARGLLTGGAVPRGLGSRHSEPAECLWIVSAEGRPNGVIRFEMVTSSLDVPCDDNAVYVYDGLSGVPDTSGAQQTQLIGVFCDGAASGIVEARSGNLTVHYRKGSSSGSGFEGVFTVDSCSSGCGPHRECDNDRCSCPKNLAGSNCEIEVCPFNCSASLSRGICDVDYGRCLCSEGFVGPDCSIEKNNSMLIITELFDSALLSDGLDHLRKTLPRFGHTLVADRRGLWMFGGYSLSHGPLNDIRLFDTKNNTWTQVTVEATPDARMPEGRYFHSAEIYHGKQNIYIYGGLGLQEKLSPNNTLGDFWQFSLKDQRWSIIDNSGERPPPIAGHTLTYQKTQEYESLVLIGGFSVDDGFMRDVWEFDLEKNAWKSLLSHGSKPIGIIGHSTVFHQPTQSFYVFGGIVYTKNGTVVSNKLFSLHYPTLRWSQAPPYNNLGENSPPATYLHSAVSTNEYMMIFGGRTDTRQSTDALMAYIFDCNQWTILDKGVRRIGVAPQPVIAHAAALDAETDGTVYLVGGWTGVARLRVTRVTLPSELCSLWNDKIWCRNQMGCSWCTSGNEEKCYPAEGEGCTATQNGPVTTNAGKRCSEAVILGRPCQVFTTCSSCSAFWPNDTTSLCRWCSDKCVSINETCDNSQGITNSSFCDDQVCPFSDCQSCKTAKQCLWTREFVNGMSQSCGKRYTIDSNEANCPPGCPTMTSCSDCLSERGPAVGLDACRWATRLERCISAAYQPVYCAGGACGLVLHEKDADRCPAPCGSFFKCSDCLRHSHCGWCAQADANGTGVCVAGSMESPVDDAARPASCDALLSLANVTHSWNYARCPPENECDNGHHDCDPVSQVCRDLPEGYGCECGHGYRPGPHGICEPVCAHGCVRGVCVSPDVCHCDFGYVGANCSIQCQCNGHSDCEGPDKLDHCLECHNNTMGEQCEHCKPQFVSSGSEGGACIPCRDHCHGHATECVLGPDGLSQCLHCANNTDGARCDICRSGFFRGTLDPIAACRPCDCNGHGDYCDPVTGDKCNCGNNTESDATCDSKQTECWSRQCARCRDSYLGDPRHGHQCYKIIIAETKMCFDAKTIDECRSKPKPLHPGQTVFFVVSPRFMNVDIRIIVDVTHGAVDLFLSPNDSSFIVTSNSTTGAHLIELDPKLRHDTSSIMFSLDDHIIQKSHHSSWSLDGKTQVTFADYKAGNLATFITVDRRHSIVGVRDLRNRLVLTLPQSIHDLTHTKFYLIVRATHVEDGSPSYGLVFFRQDQLHIDLFVFFSVFFSCFFLFLAACVVAWKAKQAADMRRARRRHVVEMLHMAKRPFACARVCVWGARRAAIAPIAVEPTADQRAAVTTLVLRLPGGKSAPVRLGLASALVLVTPPTSRRRLRVH